MNTAYEIFCDGGSRGNPGPSASAFVIIKDKQLVYKNAEFIGNSTNNLAEYYAILMAVKWLEKNQKPGEMIKMVIFNLDSQLAVRQLNGNYKIKNENIRKIFTEIKGLEKKLFKNIKYKYISRQKNSRADLLVNLKLNEISGFTSGS